MSNYYHQWQNGNSVELNCSKVVCVGKNYADHIKEMNSTTPKQPVLFIKPPSALCSANKAIKISHLQHLGAMHHEIELALLVGKKSNYKPKHSTLDMIAGVGLGIDLTLRDIQTELKNQGLPWERSKSFDGSCALSAFIQTNDKYKINFEDISLKLLLNSKTQQSSNSSLMLNSIINLLDDIQDVFTLEPGDVILTGTPAGVGPLHAGDRISGYLNNQQLIIDTEII